MESSVIGRKCEREVADGGMAPDMEQRRLMDESSDGETSTPLLVALNCLEECSVERDTLAGIADFQHVGLVELAGGKVEEVVAVVVPSLAHLPGAAKKYKSLKRATESEISQSVDVFLCTCLGAGDPLLPNFCFRQVCIYCILQYAISDIEYYQTISTNIECCMGLQKDYMPLDFSYSVHFELLNEYYCRWPLNLFFYHLMISMQVLVDKSTQATELECLIPLVRGAKQVSILCYFFIFTSPFILVLKYLERCFYSGI